MLNINEIFCSFDGEVSSFCQGRRTVFVRLQECNIQCPYCDTKHSTYKKNSLLFENKHILEIIDEYQCDKVTITGGEPLLQANEVLDLVCDLKKNQIQISIETNGSIEIKPLFFSLADSWVVDYKINLAGYKFRFPIKYMDKNDWIKFPIRNENEFIISLTILSELRLINKNFNVAWSAIYPKMNNKKLMDLMNKYKVNGNINIQLHKLLGVK